MATRIQQLAYGLSANKQSNISTLAATFLRFRKLNTEIHTDQYQTETDAAEIGKGNEFIEEVFPVSWSGPGGQIQKYASAEFLTWALAYGLGNVAYASGIYTITPIDPGTTLELPYFSIVQQLAEGGGQAIDEAHIGCAVKDVEFSFNYGPGRQSAKCNVTVVGSGNLVSPSAVTLPSVLSEHYMLSQSMSLTINGTDYVGAKTILSGSMTWNNNHLLNAGYYPGSGVTTNGFSGGAAAVRGRIEIGPRTCGFQFTVRLLHTSPEYAALIAQTTGTIVLTLTYDGTHTVTITFEQVSYQTLTRTEADGIAAVTVIVAPQYNSSSGILSVSSQCGIATIAQ